MNKRTSSGLIVLVVTVIATRGALAQPVADLALYDAISKGRLDRVEDYLAEGGDPNGVIEGSPLPGTVRSLKVAIAGKTESIVVTLLRAGARLDLADMELSSVGAAGMSKALSTLLEADDVAKDLPALKRTVDSAVTFGYYDATAVLLEHLRTTDAVLSEVLWDAMNLSVGRGHDDIARLLLENGAPASGAALRAASLYSSPGMVRYLLRLGADPLEQYRDSLVPIRPRRRDGFAAIDYAWDAYRTGLPSQQRVAGFKIHDLLAAGATTTRFDARALAVDGDALLAQVSDPSEQLLRAVEWGFYDTVRTLLDARVVHDGTLLTAATISAIDTGWEDVARLLLARGAPPGGGPLHMAVRRSSPGLVRHLLEVGADPNERVNGYTAAQYWWQEDPAAPDMGPRLRAGGDPLVLHELIVHGAEVCWLGEHRERMRELNSFGLVILLNTAYECWVDNQQ